MKLFLTLVALLTASSALAQVSVDEMTCAQAQRYVRQHGRIYVRSPAGPLPVYPISPVPYCGWWVLWHNRYVTRDGVYCTVGYSCFPSAMTDD
jgi:hypothetical protein